MVAPAVITLYFQLQELIKVCGWHAAHTHTNLLRCIDDPGVVAKL